MDNMSLSTLVTLLLLVCPQRTGGLNDPPPVPLDLANQAHIFEGIGALSAGASSRLLWDYDEGARNQILDLLFKPNYGASLQLLKVEIGGDTQSGDGAEPSHEREQGQVDCSRGYETWLVREAKRRNPSVLTYGLSWGVPGWVGNESFFSADNVQYQLDWMECMKMETGVEVDYLGIWNEKPWGSVDYTTQLRAALNSAGFSATQLVMLDGAPNSDFDTALGSSAALRSAVSVVGLHYPCKAPQPAVFQQGKRLWASEEASVPATWGGAGCWGRMLNQNYVRMNMTSSIMWSLVWSAYSNLVCFGNGMLYAFQPWSNEFAVNAPVWVTAHTTQFVEPGWMYLRPGTGVLPSGGTFVALTDGLGNLTLVFETLQGSCMYHDGCLHDVEANHVQQLTFALTKSVHFPHLAQWLTNRTDHFLRLEDIAVTEDGMFEVQLPPDTIITVTTPGNSGRQTKANGDYLPPASQTGRTRPFPLPFAEDFSDYPARLTGPMVRYLADQSGAWEATGGVLRQVIERPAGRNQWACNSEPFTELGDANWTDYVASVQTRLPSTRVSTVAAARSGLCVRVSRYTGFHCGEVPGYCLYLNTTGWVLASAGPLGLTAGTTSAMALCGGHEVKLHTDWSRLQLHVRGTMIEVSVDGKSLCSVRSTASISGRVALATGWNAAEFDDLRIQRLAAPLPRPGVTAFRQLGLLTHAWGQLTCDPIPRDADQGQRNDYSGFVGMRLRILQPVILGSLGRWRLDGATSNHTLVLLGGSKQVAVNLGPDESPDDMGFAWQDVEKTELQPGIYDLVSTEVAAGDRWLDEGVSVQEEVWVEVLFSIYGQSLGALQTESSHTTYGPLNLRVHPLPQLQV